ncbi:DUF948 domain-containing protein [Cohnella cellulosilytica]|uniref:DUF948 domain-containing protein n=1 Tax=Cohnella cellulosilytica TaxID=986710 RepID=A0ABW2F489_9BACL
MDSNELLAWSVAVAALAFIVMCGFIIALLRTARESLMTAQVALKEVTATVEGLRGEVGKLAVSVNDVAADVKHKLRSTDPLFHAVHDVGDMLSELTGTAREAAHSLTKTVRRQAAASEESAGPVPKWLRWAAIGSRVVSGILKGKELGVKSPYPQAKEGL